MDENVMVQETPVVERPIEEQNVNASVVERPIEEQNVNRPIEEQNVNVSKDRPWVDRQGRPIVRDVNGKIIPYGTGKCVTCGRDAVTSGGYVSADGKPLAYNAQGKQVGVDRHGNKFDDNGNLVETKRSIEKPFVVDENGNEIKE
jgi:hypothetical protein